MERAQALKSEESSFIPIHLHHLPPPTKVEARGQMCYNFNISMIRDPHPYKGLLS